jgi:hypothetical protein
MLQDACEALCIVPGPLRKKDAIRIFKDVNQSSRFYNTYFCSRNISQFINTVCTWPLTFFSHSLTIFPMNSEADYDQHEMNRYEFVKAIDVIGKSVGIPSLEDLCFGEAKKIGLVCLEDREKRRGRNSEEIAMQLCFTVDICLVDL